MRILPLLNKLFFTNFALFRGRHGNGMRNSVIAVIVIIIAISFVICDRQLRVFAEPKQFIEEHSVIPRNQLFRKGVEFINDAEPDSAMAYFTLAARGYNSSSLSQREMMTCARALSNIGYLNLFYFNDYPAAYSALQSSNDIAEKEEMYRTKCINDINIANIYSIYSDYGAAVGMYHDAFDTAVENDLWDLMIISFLNLADIYFDEEDKNISMDREMELFDIYPAPDSIPLAAYSRNIYRGLKKADVKDYDNAIRFLRLAKDSLGDVVQNERYRYNADFMISRSYQLTGRNAEAVGSLKSVLRDSAIRANRDVEAKIYKRLNEIYEEENNRDSALLYKMKYLELGDSIFNIRNITAVKDLSAAHERQEFSSMLSHLTEKELFQRKLLWVIGTVMLLALLLLAVIIISNRKLRQRNADLFGKNEELMKFYERESVQRMKKKTDTSPAEEGKEESSSEDSLYLKIRECMEGEEIFSKEFNATRLATLCGTSARNISAVLSEHNASFPALLAELRVREAMRRLGDTRGKYSQLTLEAIGESVGFKTRSTFSTTFKKFTGLSPKDFRKLSKERQ